MKEVYKIKEKVTALVLLLFIGCIAMTFVKPICQDLDYHQFADRSEYFSIPNFWNVVSNFPFLMIGALGMLYVAFKWNEMATKILQPNYFIFFLGILLTGFGSSYYHWNPNNQTLVWDRLPMTISFMSVFSIIIGEYIGTKYGRTLLILLLILGISSVFYWSYSESIGCGDLRMYMAVQFFPMILIPLIMILFKPGNYPAKYLWLVLLAYIVAKVFERFDLEIAYFFPLSGHTIKHLFAAVAPLIFLMGIGKRNTCLPQAGLIGNC